MMAPLYGSQAERVSWQRGGVAMPLGLDRGGNRTLSRYGHTLQGGTDRAASIDGGPSGVAMPSRGPLSQATGGVHGSGAAGGESDSCGSSSNSEVQQGDASTAGDAGGLVKGAWSAEEDAMLLQYVQRYGSKNWGSIRAKVKGFQRCGKSCRLRYVNHLRGGLKKTAMSPDEERQVLELHRLHGNKWAKIAAELPGRTDNEIKNFWNCRQKRLLRSKQLAALAGAFPQPQALYGGPACVQGGGTMRSLPFVAPPSPALPPASPHTSSTESIFTADTCPASSLGPGAMRHAPYRRFYVPPLILPEVEPLEDIKPEPPAPSWGGYTSTLPAARLYPPFCGVPGGSMGSWSLGTGGAFSPFAPPSLSPPPQLPMLLSPTADIDSYLVSSLEGNEDYKNVGQAPGGCLSALGKRGRKDFGEDTMQGHWGGSGGARYVKASWGSRLEESEGECESGVTNAASRLMFSDAVSRSPLPLQLCSSSWPLWLEEASPCHRLEVEAAAMSLYPLATAFLASMHPNLPDLDSAAADHAHGGSSGLPPLVSLEELGSLRADESQTERLMKVASWSSFLCNVAAEL